MWSINLFTRTTLVGHSTKILLRKVSSMPFRKDFAKLQTKDIQSFERLLGGSTSGAVLTTSANDDLCGYNSDWLKQYVGKSQIVLKPKTTEEVAEIVKYCYHNHLAICVQGGNTGLVGGSVPVFDEIIINTSRMNKIYDFDTNTGVLTCQPGCVLQALDTYVSDHGYMMPFDLGAKGSCQIGGNISTAAGGIRFIRYGSLHAYVLGLEVVAPKNGGQILNMMSTVRKDNTGFHLPHLFIGAEGQLGLITKIAMTCVPKPSSVSVAFLGLSSFQKCCNTLKLAKKHLGEILSSFEFMDKAAVKCSETNAKISTPLGSEHKFYLLVETMGVDEAHDAEKLERFLQVLTENKIVDDGCIAADSTQSKKIWRLRESFTEALVVDGYVYKYDISLPLKHFYEIVEQARIVGGDLATRVVAYGHLGDGNVHLNVTSNGYSEQLDKKLNPFIFAWIRDHGGSISAEHGLGFAKRNYIHYAKNAQVVQQFRELKNVFDPKGILNPYKCIPD